MNYLLTIIVFLIGCGITHAQTYLPNWESLDQRETPQWWKEAKFGIFIHWGPYSVPAYAPVDEVEGIYEKYAEHYENRLLQKNKLFQDYHTKTYGRKFTYQDFAPLFKAEHFNPNNWAQLFKDAGAKYVVLTSKHHDGFCLWPSEYSPRWNSYEIGSNRDLAGELTQAVRDNGLHMGFYYSLLEWNHPLYKKETIDTWVDQHMIPQMKELVTKYKPEIIFSDGEWDYNSDTLKSESFLAWLYNESAVKDVVVVNDRWGKETRSLHGDYYTTEYDLVHNNKGIGDKSNHAWEESRGIGTSYGFNKFETNKHYFSSKQLIDLLIDKVSNGGNLLLNVGPQADGLIPVVMQERLLAIGKWLNVNGESIYGTTTTQVKKELLSKEENISFTQKGKDLYVICKKWPSGELIIDGIKHTNNISLLGTDHKIKSKIKNKKLHITVPTININDMPCEYAWVFKISDAF
ncbi:alpha-L-fucosidase [Sphingobacterium rhinopitheci]|uniref:alpha-L-fucosidase n=1 Tax=Sphingobacterium rhinopitheci TaxID=2781960 RepID=UPI001F521782|nr:alpha-L-fucosidase [Sphingobacterium rhinopitheci]MCI0920196.1 alpha-L-fucosidase [Sphingobacterium rhinopitheci]